MAKINTRIDDLGGKGEAQPVKFSLQGKHYSLDLNDENRTELVKALEKFTKAATATTPTARTSNPDATAIREWAAKNGHEVSSRGRLPQAVVEAYQAAR